MSWSYIKSGILGEEQVGPISDQEFKELVANKTIRDSTKIHHPAFTKGKYAAAISLDIFIEVRSKIEQEKKKLRAEHKAKEAEKKRIAKRQLELRIEAEAAENEERASKVIRRTVNRLHESSTMNATDGTSSGFVSFVLCLVFGILFLLFSVAFGPACGFTGVFLLVSSAVLRCLGEISSKLGAWHYMQYNKAMNEHNKKNN